MALELNVLVQFLYLKLKNNKKKIINVFNYNGIVIEKVNRNQTISRLKMGRKKKREVIISLPCLTQAAWAFFVLRRLEIASLLIDAAFFNVCGLTSLDVETYPANDFI